MEQQFGLLNATVPVAVAISNSSTIASINNNNIITINNTQVSAMTPWWMAQDHCPLIATLHKNATKSTLSVVPLFEIAAGVCPSDTATTTRHALALQHVSVACGLTVVALLLLLSVVMVVFVLLWLCQTSVFVEMPADYVPAAPLQPSSVTPVVGAATVPVPGPEPASTASDVPPHSQKPSVALKRRVAPQDKRTRPVMSAASTTLRLDSLALDQMRMEARKAANRQRVLDRVLAAAAATEQQPAKKTMMAAARAMKDNGTDAANPMTVVSPPTDASTVEKEPASSSTTMPPSTTSHVHDEHTGIDGDLPLPPLPHVLPQHKSGPLPSTPQTNGRESDGKESNQAMLASETTTSSSTSSVKDVASHVATDNPVDPLPLEDVAADSTRPSSAMAAAMAVVTTTTSSKKAAEMPGGSALVAASTAVVPRECGLEELCQIDGCVRWTSWFRG